MPDRKIALALAVVPSLVLTACGGTRPATPTHRAPLTSASASPPPSAASAINAFVPEAERFVTAHRGLAFKRPVPVTLLADAPFKKRLLGEGTSDAKAVENAVKELRAVGLIEGHPDLAKLEQALIGDAVVGFYDPKAAALVVRGATLTPYTKEVLVHELTHAAQDQWFGVERPALKGAKDEQEVAFTALLEGDAVRIENEYRDSLSGAERDQAEREGNAGGLPHDVPRILLEELVFPYVYGPTFVSAVLKTGGQTRLDAAFRTPPTTTAQIIHPELFLRGTGAVTVTKPASEGTAFDEGVVGEWDLSIILREAGGATGPSPADATAAAAGWTGDRYVAFDERGRSCLRANFAAHDSQGRHRLAALLRDTGRARGWSVTEADTVQLTACA